MTIPVFAHVAAISYFIPATYGILNWKNNGKALKTLTVFLIYTIFHVAFEFLLGRMNISNQFLINFHQLIEFECIIYIFRQWTSKRTMKDVFHIFALLYLVFWFTEITFISIPTEFRESISTTANVLLILSALVIGIELFRTTELPVTQHSIFWIAAGVILYTSGTVVVVTISNSILKAGIEYFNAMWHIIWGFTIISNIFYARSFRCSSF